MADGEVKGKCKQFKTSTVAQMVEHRLKGPQLESRSRSHDIVLQIYDKSNHIIGTTILGTTHNPWDYNVILGKAI